MFHKTRAWSVADIATPEELAEKLTQHTWCGCNGFRLGGYLFLNDSTSADGAQEYGVVQETSGRQIESITFGWCSEAQALHYIRQVLAGEFDAEHYADVQPGQIVPTAGHRCHLCA